MLSRILLAVIIQGLYGHEKSGGKCPFLLGHGMSGKPAMVREVVLLYRRSGKIFFIIAEIVSVVVLLSKFVNFYASVLVSFVI